MQEMRLIDFCRILLELFRMALVNLVTFLVLKILDNLFFLQNSLIQITADVNKISKTVQDDLAVILNVLSEPSIHFA